MQRAKSPRKRPETKAKLLVLRLPPRTWSVTGRESQQEGTDATASTTPQTTRWKEKKKAGNKQRQTKTRETGREKKSEQNRTKQRASGREHNKNGNGNDARQHQIPSPPEVWRPGGAAGQWNRREEHFKEGRRFAGRAGFVWRRSPWAGAGSGQNGRLWRVG